MDQEVCTALPALLLQLRTGWLPRRRRADGARQHAINEDQPRTSPRQLSPAARALQAASQEVTEIDLGSSSSGSDDTDAQPDTDGEELAQPVQPKKRRIGSGKAAECARPASRPASHLWLGSLGLGPRNACTWALSPSAGLLRAHHHACRGCALPVPLIAHVGGLHRGVSGAPGLRACSSRMGQQGLSPALPSRLQKWGPCPRLRHTGVCRAKKEPAEPRSAGRKLPASLATPPKVCCSCRTLQGHCRPGRPAIRLHASHASHQRGSAGGKLRTLMQPGACSRQWQGVAAVTCAGQGPVSCRPEQHLPSTLLTLTCAGQN